MQRVISFDVFGKPQPKGSTRAFVNRRRDGQLIANVAPDNSRSGSWQTAIGWAAKAAAPSVQPFAGPIALSVSFYLERPQRAPMFPTRKPDLDKLIRCVLDALTGVAYSDDSQVIAIYAFKYYALDTPRASIVVRELLE